MVGASRYDNKGVRIHESIILNAMEISICFTHTIADPITENVKICVVDVGTLTYIAMVVAIANARSDEKHSLPSSCASLI